MEYLVKHRTTYRYLQDVSYSCHLAHLNVRETPNQHVFSSTVSLDPEPASRERRTPSARSMAASSRTRTVLTAMSRSPGCRHSLLCTCREERAGVVLIPAVGEVIRTRWI